MFDPSLTINDDDEEIHVNIPVCVLYDTSVGVASKVIDPDNAGLLMFVPSVALIVYVLVPGLKTFKLSKRLILLILVIRLFDPSLTIKDDAEESHDNRHVCVLYDISVGAASKVIDPDDAGLLMFVPSVALIVYVLVPGLKTFKLSKR